MRMLKYTLSENNRSLSITNKNLNQTITYNLGGSVSILNKFDLIVDFSRHISNCAGELGNEYNEWLWKIVNDYDKAYKHDMKVNDLIDDDQILDENKSQRFTLIKSNLNKIRYFVDKFYTEINFDFKQFSNFKNISKKTKKKTIVFTEENIKNILYVSAYMKIYYLISHSTEKSLGIGLHREIYNDLVDGFVQSDVAEKIYNIVKTKTYKYNMSDKAMWEYLKNFQGKSLDVHIGETFNLLLNNILVYCEYNMNPITFMVIVINNNSRWVLHSIYVHNIQYEGKLSTEDIHTITSDNLKTYGYNQTLGQLKTLAESKIIRLLENTKRIELEKLNPMILEDDLESKVNNYIIDVQHRIEKMSIHSPIHHFLTFPLLAKLCDIPYYHMKTIDADYACKISMYLHLLLKEVFCDEYSNLFDILNYGVLGSPSVTTTFQLKHGELLINMLNKKKFMTFRSKIIPHKLINHFIGVVSRNKDGYLDIRTGDIQKSFSISKIEPEIIKFFINFWSDSFDPEIKRMQKIIKLGL